MPLDAEVYAESLYAFLKARYGISVARGEDVLEATLAEGAVAKRLGVPPGFPAFKRTRVTFDRGGTAVEYSVCYYPGDKYKYMVRL
jgi:GntR family transcriptional regulator